MPAFIAQRLRSYLARRSLAFGRVAASAIASPLALFTSAGVVAQEPPTATQIAAIEAEAAPTSGGDGTREIDPWEGFNRDMFKVHTFLDDNLLEPGARVYRATTPAQGRRGIRRLLANARTPGILVNDLLQGEFRRAGATFSRFVVNSTLGAGGFADPMGNLGMPGHREDFGQTLAVWGVGQGPYLIVPLLGPTTIRDGVGTGVQLALDPSLYIRTPPANYARIVRAGAAGLSAREAVLDPLDDIRSKSLDYYASLRSFYLQSRAREIANDRESFGDLPDIEDFEEFDEIE